jgi:hypothetical protein
MKLLSTFPLLVLGAKNWLCQSAVMEEKKPLSLLEAYGSTDQYRVLNVLLCRYFALQVTLLTNVLSIYVNCQAPTPLVKHCNVLIG